jgi:sulfite reductase (NADPH) flavoprotein alpha-component
MTVPVLPESAPFSLDQRMWLNGFLAGLANGLIPAALPAAAPALPVLVVYASQSGTAEGLAHAFADKLKAAAFANGSPAEPRVVCMQSYKDIAWAAEKTILMLTSTWGDGDMPDNGVAFWEWLKSPEAPALAHVNYAVLGLGDKTYTRFCQAGKNLDSRFAELGAKRMLPLCECDTDYEAKTEEWMAHARGALEPLAAALGGSGGSSGASAEAAPASATLSHPAATGPSVIGANGHSHSAANGSANGASAHGVSVNGTSANGAPANGARGAHGTAKTATAHSRKNPFPAALLENHPLNAKGSAKDTRHIALSLLGSGLEYRAGDALGVQPRNCYELVDRVILSLNCLGNEKVALEGGEEMALRAALLNRLDLRRGSEKLLRRLLEVCRNGGEQRRLRELTSGGEEKLKPYLSERDLLDVLEDFPHTRIDAQDLAGTLPKLAPRLYSIASSPKENPGEVHLTIGVVRYLSDGRLRRGVSSTFLAERVPLGLTVPVFVQPAAHFGLPADGKTPIIMVGPGTGIAPFRAFLQERRANGDAGKNWLFFGDQRRRFDFLYSEEFAGMQAAGHLSRLDLAFSRDQEEKVYVQDRMLERSKELYAWLEEGAHFYVCGDAKRMAKDVEAALLHVIAKESGKGPDEAKAYLEKLKEGKRYQRDVY